MHEIIATSLFIFHHASRRLGHYNLRELAPNDIAKFCRYDASSDQVVHDATVAPPPLHVHVIQGPALNQAQTVEALNNCKLTVKVDRSRFASAVKWWREHNAEAATAPDPVLPVLYDDMPAGVFATSTPTETASTSPGNIAQSDPAKNAQTVYTQANSAGRSAVLVSIESEDLKKAGVFRGQAYDGNQLICAAGALIPGWDPRNFNRIYPTLIPYARGGPTEARATGMSMGAYVAHCLRLSHRGFGQHPSFTLERYSEARLSKISAVRFNQLKCRPKIISNVMSVTPKQLEIAAKYQDDCKRALQNNCPRPQKPLTVIPAAEKMLLSAQVPLSSAHGTEMHAIANRNKLFAIQRMYGGFSHFSTTTPDDLNCPMHGKRAGSRREDGLKAMAQAISMDSAACALMHLDIVNMFIDHFIGWDRAKNQSKAGGGIFGTFTAWGGVTEEQWRKSLHLHLLACIKGFARTPAQLKEWILSARFRSDILEFAQRTLTAGPLIKPQELFDTCTSVKHDIACHPNCGVQCTQDTIEGEEKVGGGEDFFAGGGRDVVVGMDGIPNTVPLQLMRMPRKVTHASEAMKDGEVLPDNIACSRCGHQQSTYDATLAWALEHATQEVVAAYTSGEKGFHGIDIDVQAAVLSDDDSTAEVLLESAQARAALILLCEQYINHRHKPSCFKDNKNALKKNKRCRFRVPAQVAGSYTLVVNNEVHISLSTNSDLELELKNIHVVDFALGTSPLFAFTPRHNAIHLSLLRSNVNSQIVSTAAGACFYLTSYASKLPAFKDCGKKMSQQFTQQVQKEARAAPPSDDADPERTRFLQANARLARMQWAGSAPYGVAGTTAALYMLNKGELTWHSHKFSNLDLKVSLPQPVSG